MYNKTPCDFERSNTQTKHLMFIYQLSSDNAQYIIIDQCDTGPLHGLHVCMQKKERLMEDLMFIFILFCEEMLAPAMNFIWFMRYRATSPKLHLRSQMVKSIMLSHNIPCPCVLYPQNYPYICLYLQGKTIDRS